MPPRPPKSPTNPTSPPGLLRPIHPETAAPLPPELQSPEPGTPRARIIEAARQLFADVGFETTSTRAIADAAGVNLAMIHYYYGSKEQLYERVLTFEMLAMFRSVAGAFSLEARPEEILIGIPLGVARTMRQRRAWGKIFRREVAGGGERLKQVIRNLGDFGPLRARELFSAAYEQGVREGDVHDLPPDAVREMLLTLGFAITFFAPMFTVITGRDLEDDANWNEWLKTLEALLRRGLLVEKHR